MVTAPPLLALEFGNPNLLWGLLLAVAPLLLHLLFRPAQQVEPWGAMQFLQAALRRRRNRLRLESLLHLLVRTALLALLPLAAAQPRTGTLGKAAAPGRPVHRVLIIDTSLSMNARSDAGAVLERTRRSWEEIVDRSETGDSFQLVQTRAHGQRIVIAHPSFDLDSVRRELDALRPTYGRSLLEPALRDALTLLDSAPTTSEREVVLITDMQRHDWIAERGQALRQLRAALRAVSARARLVILNVGNAVSNNATVAGIRTARPWHFIGIPGEIQVDVRRMGDGPSAVHLDLLVDGVPHSRQSLEITDGSVETATFPVTWTAPGEHVLTARLAQDDLIEDNQRYLVISAARSVRVLLVGQEGGGPSGRSVDYVRVALAPPRTGTEQTPLHRYEVHSASETELRQLNLDQFDCVILRNFTYISLEEAARLKNYVRRGGGLLIAAGDSTDLDSFNSLLVDAEQLAPARLIEPVGSIEPPNTPLLFETDVPEHPVVRPFRQFPEGGFATTRIYRYFKVDNVPPNATVVVRLTNRDPILIDTALGQGRVLLSTTPFNDQWGSWVVWPSFLPMLHEAVQWAASGRVARRSVEVGNLLTWETDDDQTGREVVIECPDGRVATPQTAADAVDSSLVFRETALPGIYRVAWGGNEGRIESFAVNVPPDEGDLLHVVPADLTRSTLQGVDFRTQWGPQAAWGTSAGSGDLPHDFSGLLLLIALFLLVVDLLSSWNFAAGVSLLAAGAATGLIHLLLPLETMAAAGVTLALALILWIAGRAALRN